MKIFVDSAIIQEIQQVYQWKLGSGVTTNPSLMKKAVEAGAAANLRGYVQQILLVAGKTPVSLEVTETTAAGMIREGKALYQLFKPYGNVVIKIPINPAFKKNDTTHFDGLIAIRALSQEGIPINSTLVFTPEQALLAAKAGAKFVSPFAGRVDDYLRKKWGVLFGKADYYPAQGAIVNGKAIHDEGIVSGVHLVKACLDAIRKQKLPTKVLAASLRNPWQVAEMESIGVDIATIPFEAIVAMREHPALLPVLHFPKLQRKKKSSVAMLQHQLTFEGMKKFTADIVEEYVQLTR